MPRSSQKKASKASSSRGKSASNSNACAGARNCN